MRRSVRLTVSVSSTVLEGSDLDLVLPIPILEFLDDVAQRRSHVHVIELFDAELYPSPEGIEDVLVVEGAMVDGRIVAEDVRFMDPGVLVEPIRAVARQGDPEH